MDTKPRSSSAEHFRKNKVSVVSVASQRAVQVELDVLPAVDSSPRKVSLLEAYYEIRRRGERT